MIDQLDSASGTVLVTVLQVPPQATLGAVCPAAEGSDAGAVGLQAQAMEAELKPLMELMKEALGERIEKVVASQRLADSPCALATSKFGWSAYQERIMRSQVCQSACGLGHACVQAWHGGIHGTADQALKCA